MKAISFSRPGAQAITDGTCRIINKHYMPGDLHKEYFAIHSSQSYSTGIKNSLKLKGYVASGHEETGIVGVAKISGTTNESDSPWFDGPIGWVLEDIRVFRNPIQIGGLPAPWELPTHVKDMLRGRWNDSFPGIVEQGGSTTMGEVPVLCISVQTTGLTRRDKVCGISLLEVYNGTITEDLTCVINPHRQIPKRVSMVHGIEQKDVRKERGILAHKNKINRMMNRARFIVGHDVFFSIKYLAKQVNPIPWNKDASIADSKLLSNKSWVKLAEEYSSEHNTFYAKQRARASYDIVKQLTNNNAKTDVNLGTYIDKAKIWNGEKANE